MVGTSPAHSIHCQGVNKKLTILQRTNVNGMKQNLDTVEAYKETIITVKKKMKLQ